VAYQRKGDVGVEAMVAMVLMVVFVLTALAVLIPQFRIGG